MSGTPKHPDPSPQEIREKCRVIQSRWTEGERQRRMAYRELLWELPECPLNSLACDLESPFEYL